MTVLRPIASPSRRLVRVEVHFGMYYISPIPVDFFHLQILLIDRTLSIALNIFQLTKLQTEASPVPHRASRAVGISGRQVCRLKSQEQRSSVASPSTGERRLQLHSQHSQHIQTLCPPSSH